VRELADYEKLSHEVDATEEMIGAALFAAGLVCGVLLYTQQQRRNWGAEPSNDAQGSLSANQITKV